MYDAEALGVLRQVAARARPGPWRVALAQRDGRVEVLPLASVA